VATRQPTKSCGETFFESDLIARRLEWVGAGMRGSLGIAIVVGANPCMTTDKSCRR
jgi:hypothetical protein